MPRLSLLLAALFLASAASAQISNRTVTRGTPTTLSITPVDRMLIGVDGTHHEGRQEMPFSGSASSYGSPELVVPDGAWVTRIKMGERSNKPCSIELGWTMIENGRSRTGSLDWGCTPRRGSVKTLRTYNTRESLGAIKGLRVCQRNSNDRLKGLEIGGTSITGMSSTYATIGEGAGTQDFDRPNCNDWEHQPQLCPAGTVLIGVRISGNTRRTPEIKGLAPVCARLRIERQ